MGRLPLQARNCLGSSFTFKLWQRTFRLSVSICLVRCHKNMGEACLQLFLSPSSIIYSYGWTCEDAEQWRRCCRVCRCSLANLFLTHHLNSIIFIGDPIEQNIRDWEDFFGPSDWFEETLPRLFIRTRSLYYRYKTSSSRDSIVDDISVAAQYLLSEYAKLEIDSPVGPFTGTCDNAVARNRGPSRSVIFVCQSSGGAVVEEVRRNSLVELSIVDL